MVVRREPQVESDRQARFTPVSSGSLTSTARCGNPAVTSPSSRCDPMKDLRIYDCDCLLTCDPPLKLFHFLHCSDIW
ncbi:hypothetical protein STRIP9103_03721 [Streptomyces ipomoeae 91-03]|uniref:Uncharacterized protein n=1 Tax=Streptomyces ipomoeae 91-03 TaxID=698759 RepID=L1L469_9ACTN|nr:hypothetical protein STRIP9103_03721 [Streptomyces ipomoeae 91-03]